MIYLLPLRMSRFPITTSWLSDERENIHAFAKAHIAELERQINAEQKRADQEIAMRRSQFEIDDSNF